METKETTDEKTISIKDVEDVIHDMEQHYQYVGEYGSPYGCGYNNAIKECITLIEKRLLKA